MSAANNPLRHTAEPWQVLEDGRARVSLVHVETPMDHPTPGVPIFSINKKRIADAARIVECVNALAGISDPIQALRWTKELLTAMAARVGRKPHDCDDLFFWARDVLERLNGAKSLDASTPSTSTADR